MGEQHPFIGDRDDIIVEGASSNRLFRLLDEKGASWIEAVQSGDGAARFDMLARRIGATGNAIDEDFDARIAMPGRQAHEVGRAFIAERRRYRAMHCKMRFVAKGQT